MQSRDASWNQVSPRLFCIWITGVGWLLDFEGYAQGLREPGSPLQ